MDCAVTNSNSDATFFQFPQKSDKRYYQWLQLTQCDPGIKNKFICEKHFDPIKHMSLNPRRKMLLNNAMPCAYVPTESGSEVDVEEFNFSITTDQEDQENIFITKTLVEIDEGWFNDLTIQ